MSKEEPLEKEMATHSSILAWEIPEQRSLVGYNPWGCKVSDTTWWLKNKDGQTVVSWVKQVRKTEIYTHQSSEAKTYTQPTAGASSVKQANVQKQWLILSWFSWLSALGLQQMVQGPSSVDGIQGATDI